MSDQLSSKTAIIVGAGPAGLTAAYELLKRTDIIPIILEKSGDIGGISKTTNYKGNRIDIGGHRFFSKSDRVMQWWLDMMPIETGSNGAFTISYQNKSRTVAARSVEITSPANPDNVMLVRNRLSRIYFLRKFFSYPIQLSIDTLTKLGIARTVSIMLSYLTAQLFPRKPEKNLEDFMINRFGKTLYRLFFKDYTEKVWGIACSAISAEWGAQRIKGVSISKAIEHAIHSALKQKKNSDISQKDTETSLIEQFLYPKYGPGQLWEEVARQVQEMGGKILMHHDVKKIHTGNNAILGIEANNTQTGTISYLEGDYFFSTMPVQELIGGMDGAIPENVREVASGLQYRDFITVGILLKQLSYQDNKTGEWKPLQLKDTWIYIQEKDVTVGRLQVFNNWSPYLVKDPQNTWIGMEFFTNQSEPFWNKSDEQIKEIAIAELERIGLATSHNVLDSTVLRVEKTYPAYFGTYENFHLVREYADRFENLFLVGRNGMHKYNNSDHSMLTAMVAVDNIAAGITTKENIWSINTEQEYHEEKKTGATESETVQSPGQERKKEWAFPKPQWQGSFKDYIFKNPAYKWFLVGGAAALLLQLIIFKFLYPYASFINGDSYVYLESAYWNMDINVYPIGYSRFLRIFSVFSTSDTALVVFQYLCLQASIMGLLFTLYYWFEPGKLVKILLFCLMLLNPVLLFLANYISSDALFVAMSLAWFTQLLWIIYRPGKSLILTNAVLLFVAFTFRYNAMYYPLIGIIATVLSTRKMFLKLGGVALGLLLIAGFVQFSSNRYDEISGKRQFSPFTGWQMANNAMYAYKFVVDKDFRSTPQKFKKLDQMVRTYFDTTSDYRKHPEEAIKASTIYMWSPASPLQRYMSTQFKGDTTADPIKQWASVGPLYGEYGRYLILKYPMAFTKYYLWPNAMRFYAPPIEFLNSYNMGVDSVNPIATHWFKYRSNKISSYFKDFKIKVLDFFPILTGMMNVVFLVSALAFFYLKAYRNFRIILPCFILVVSLWVVNFGFSVLASPVALRFQLFPIITCLSFSFLLIEMIWKLAK